MNKREDKGDEQKREEEEVVMLGLGKMRVLNSQGFGGNFVIKTQPKIKEVRLIQGKFLNAQSNLCQQPQVG